MLTISVAAPLSHLGGRALEACALLLKCDLRNHDGRHERNNGDDDEHLDERIAAT